MTSSFSDTTVAVTQLDFGGNSGLPTDGANAQLEASDEFSWMSDDAAHRFKLGGLVNITSFSSMNAFNSDGTFLFNSLSDLETNTPAMFTRSLMPTSRTGSGLNSAIYLGDTWRHSRALQVTYGMRVEASDFQGHPAYNPEIEQLFWSSHGQVSDRGECESARSASPGCSAAESADKFRRADSVVAEAVVGAAVAEGSRW